MPHRQMIEGLILGTFCLTHERSRVLILWLNYTSKPMAVLNMMTPAIYVHDF